MIFTYEYFTRRNSMSTIKSRYESRQAVRVMARRQFARLSDSNNQIGTVIIMPRINFPEGTVIILDGDQGVKS
jgi:hypothetical protein